MAVRKELFRRRRRKNLLRSLFDSYAFFQRCDGYEKGAVGFHGTVWYFKDFMSWV